MVHIRPKQFRPTWLARPCSESTEPISINYAPFDATWSETVPFWIALRLNQHKWTKLVQNHQKSWRPCSETTEPILMNYAPYDTPWSETVPFWILLRLDQHKWTKLVQNHQKSWLARPCSETTEPISMNYAPFRGGGFGGSGGAAPPGKI